MSSPPTANLSSAELRSALADARLYLIFTPQLCGANDPLEVSIQYRSVMLGVNTYLKQQMTSLFLPPGSPDFQSKPGEAAGNGSNKPFQRKPERDKVGVRYRWNGQSGQDTVIDLDTMRAQRVR